MVRNVDSGLIQPEFQSGLCSLETLELNYLTFLYLQRNATGDSTSTFLMRLWQRRCVLCLQVSQHSLQAYGLRRPWCLPIP